MHEKTPDENRLDRIRAKIKDFPAAPGLYFMKDARDTVLYIGKAKNLRSRVASYFQRSSDLASSRGQWIVDMVSRTRTVDYLECESEIDAVLREARLIKDIHPPYNSQLTDDKSFPYLEITTQDDFPGVYITRNPKSDKSRLFGPFTTGRDLRAVLVLLQKIYKFRTCHLEIDAADAKRRFFRPCLLYSIKQCTAPCAARIDKDEYRKLIGDLTRFLNSKRSTVLADLRRKMNKASKDLDFERAAMYRDRVRLIERLDERGSVEDHVQPEVFAKDPTDALDRLRKILKADEPIRIIEGFDIAHISGTDTVASLVKFIDGRPFKSGYRRFKIKTVKGIDDYASMKEVITRRYRQAAKGEELLPDLILIDGGRGQLNAALAALHEIDAPVPLIIGLAKKHEEIFTPDREDPIRLAAHNPARKLLQYVRDEAHRFAQHYHHILRKKSLLDEK
ncbi:Excinuclease ABC subunit C [Anaerohalosphaera lusitana]|uniref:Excinuclease ABC subunit C n=1 Tax=Anaerohalosphaera lusitana TaxID=1936003 RepID=A0A1U9NIA0_9BACT|nr:excinuclease ABC subunit UvrC [Anaerohalosphaera lusitana]AQT67468.1 Excinuclease ABC subunit C [Anaerohalosphaera lusitana]